MDTAVRSVLGAMLLCFIACNLTSLAQERNTLQLLLRLQIRYFLTSVFDYPIQKGDLTWITRSCWRISC